LEDLDGGPWQVHAGAILVSGRVLSRNVQNPMKHHSCDILSSPPRRFFDDIRVDKVSILSVLSLIAKRFVKTPMLPFPEVMLK